MSKFDHVQKGEKVNLKRKPNAEENAREALAEMQEFMKNKYQDFKPKVIMPRQIKP